MKIAVIGARDLTVKPDIIERYCQKLYPQIAAKGHQIDLFVQPSYHQPCFSINFYQRIKIIALLSIPGRQLHLLNLLLNSALNTIWATCGNYDIIHIHGMVSAWFAWFPQLFSGSSIVITCHQLDCQPSQWHRLWRRLLPRLEKMAVQNANEIVVTSQALSGYFNQKYGIYPQYIATAPTNYNSTSPGYGYYEALGLTNKPYILYWGQIKPDRRLDLLIRAFQQLHSPDWRLVIMGDIEAEPQYVSNLLSLTRQQGKVFFLGEIRSHGLGEIIAGASLFVEPSVGHELNIPTTLLEVMRQGIPILASDTITHRQLLNQEHGLLFKSGRLNSLQRQLTYAISQPDLLQVMAKKAQQYIAVHHNWDKVTYQNLFLYRQIAAKLPLKARKDNAFDN